MASILLVVWFLLLTFTAIDAALPYNCRNEQNQPTDWWFLYRLPNPKKQKEGDPPTPDNFTPFQYFYADEQTQLSPSSKSLAKGGQSALENTLNLIYQTRQNAHYHWLAYNDHPPLSEGAFQAQWAHAKGVLSFHDPIMKPTSPHSSIRHDQGGFFLIHSQPKFPDFVSFYQYDYESPIPYTKDFGANSKPFTMNAQSFFCVSIRLKHELQAFAHQLRVMQPLIYDRSNSYNPSDENDHFNMLLSRHGEKWKTQARAPNLHAFHMNGFLFGHFAKSPAPPKSKVAKKEAERKPFLYDIHTMISKIYEASFNWQTWLWSKGSEQNSFCTRAINDELGVHRDNAIDHAFAAINVDGIRLDDNVKWPTRRDHAKIGVSREKHIVCVGDMNRAYSQRERGGGFLCVHSADTKIKDLLWTPLNQLVKIDNSQVSCETKD